MPAFIKVDNFPDSSGIIGTTKCYNPYANFGAAARALEEHGWRRDEGGGTWRDNFKPGAYNLATIVEVPDEMCNPAELPRV